MRSVPMRWHDLWDSEACMAEALGKKVFSFVNASSAFSFAFRARDKPWSCVFASIGVVFESKSFRMILNLHLDN